MKHRNGKQPPLPRRFSQLVGQVVEEAFHPVHLVLVSLRSPFHVIVRDPDRVVQLPPLALRCGPYPVPSTFGGVQGAFPYDVLAGLLGCSARAVRGFAFPLPSPWSTACGHMKFFHGYFLPHAP